MIDHVYSTQILPVRRVAAMVVCNEQGRVLIAKRSQRVDEFKGVWSFPSVFINDEDDDMLNTLVLCLRNWFALEIGDPTLIGRRMGIRPKWHLLINLYMADQRSEPIIITSKYTAIKWVDGVEYFSNCEYKQLGDCAKTYLDYLRNNID